MRPTFVSVSFKVCPLAKKDVFILIVKNAPLAYEQMAIYQGEIHNFSKDRMERKIFNLVV